MRILDQTLTACAARYCQYLVRIGSYCTRLANNCTHQRRQPHSPNSPEHKLTAAASSPFSATLPLAASSAHASARNSIARNAGRLGLSSASESDVVDVDEASEGTEGGGTAKGAAKDAKEASGVEVTLSRLCVYSVRGGLLGRTETETHPRR